MMFAPPYQIKENWSASEVTDLRDTAQYPLAQKQLESAQSATAWEQEVNGHNIVMSKHAIAVDISHWTKINKQLNHQIKSREHRK